MKKILTWLLSAALFAAAIFAAVSVNSRGRIECGSITYAQVAESGPFILSGGECSEIDGREVYTLSFSTDEELYLYFPRPKDYEISGCRENVLEVSLGRLVSVMPEGQGEISLRIFPDYEKLAGTEKCVYIGTFAQLNDFVNSSIISNYFVRGLCFAMTLICVIMCAWKNSEKYLLWIALLAFFVGDYGRLRDIFLLFGWELLTDGHVYWVLNECFVSALMYFAIREFVPVKIGKLPFLVYSMAAALPALVLYRSTSVFNYSVLLFYAVLYAMYYVCIERIPAAEKIEKHTFRLAWLLTAVLRFIEIMCQTEIFPSGDLNLRYRIRGITAVIFVVALFICAIKRFAERFERSDRLNAELEKKIREKSLENISFIRSMLHNLKTPLFSVSGYTDLALRTIEKNPAAAKQYIDKANEKAIYAGHLMDTLSLAMRVGTGQLQLNRVPLDFAETAKKCAETASPAAAAKNISVSCSFDGPLPLEGDPMYLQQAVDNIIDNAIINTPDGGSVEIFAEKSPDAQKRLLHIRDNGCGIDESEKDRIFEAYYSRRSGGTSSSGLGLYITREIIRLHGGEISVESSPGKGADFIISLPAANQSLSM